MAVYLALIQVVCSFLFALTVRVAGESGDPQKQSTRSPHGTLNIPCENCHTAASWTPIRRVPEFDHNKTKYPLRGMHEKVRCTQCHTKPVFTDVGKNCQDCHADIHQRKMGANCAQCHTVLGWNISTQQIKDHQNRFPLFGAHAAVPCEECHKSAAVGQFQGLSTACISCHLKDYQNTTNPNHVSAGFPNTCDTCHSADSWLGAKFDHSTTGFLLTNGHANVPCLSCHINNNYNLHIGPTDCGNSGCHLTTWQQTNNPVHPAAGPAFAASNCSNCHNTTGWNNVTFDHSVTGFPLTNGHANVACSACHVNNNYNLQIAPTDCGNSGCHLTTWQQTNNPVHSTSGPAFAASNCANCHTTKGWDAASFDHSVTGFTLVGTHLSPTPTPCASCHINNNYTLSSTDCMTCHLADWNSTSTIGGGVPDHKKAGFPTSASACASCHPITKWADGKFDHSTTGFPLTNSHATLLCSACHVNQNFSLQIAPTDCGNASCHLTTWQQTNNPVHSAAGSAFAVGNCSNCHGTTSWNNTTFNHSVTGFTLVGTHQSPTPTPCISCHTGNNYNLTSTDCMTCHLADWNSTSSIGGNVPDHIKSGFPTSASACSMCHPITKWSDGKFDHSTTGWALTGYHLTSTTCGQCHINGNYGLTAANTDCYGCHVADWNSTATLGGSVPNHIASGFPTTCATCHTTTSWLGATFNHTYFPIPHHGSVCSDCHLVSTNYATFSCINCHTHPYHSQSQTDPEHRGVSGYSYGATTCYNCHKNGGN